MDRLESGLADLSANVVAQGALVTSRLDSLDAKVADLSALVQDMLQGLQGVATSARQDQIIAALTTITQDLEPTKARSIGLDLSHVTTQPQPRPSKAGP